MNKEQSCRMTEAINKLDELGVFYGKNYEGEYHEKYPQSCYTFSVKFDRQRGGIESIITNGCIDKYAIISESTSKDPVIALIEVFEKSYEEILNTMKDDPLI